MHCPGGNATDPIWRVQASSDGISPWTPLKPHHSNPNPLANELWCIDFLTPPTTLIIPHSSGPKGPFGLMWLSRPQLVYNSVSNSTATLTQQFWLPSWLSYIIVQRPLDRPLDLWNRMFNRHQAEITVMQFRGHSLSVHQSMRVSWDFLACPILLANFRPRDFLS